MSVFSVIKGVIAKVNDHTQILKDYDEDLDTILERLDALEGENTSEVDPPGEISPTTEEDFDEGALKIEE